MAKIAEHYKGEQYYNRLKKQEIKIANAMIKGYRNNLKIKKAGEKIEWSIELVEEYKKCSQDPIYFIENYVKIISFDGIQTIKLYDYQRKMIENIHNKRFNIITTARQSGKSTVLCAYLLWFVLFNDEKVVALLANKGGTAREIFARIRLAFQNLPKWLQQGVVEGGWNKGSLELENNSRIIAESSSAENIRGYTIDFLFIDECAFVDNWDDFAQSVLPTITSDPLHRKKVCFVSTPNGLNHFHDYWKGAQKNTNGYNYIEVKWNQVPGRDEEWKKQTLQLLNNDHQKFAQENECAFLGSSGTLISGWKLESLRNEKDTEPLYQSDSIKKYAEPVSNHIYVLVADVSRGKGLDYSTFSVIDVSKIPNEVVCTFRSNLINAVDFAGIINTIGRSYNEAFVMVEINDIGGQVPDVLFDEYEYENIIHTQSRGRSGKKVSSNFGDNIDRGIRTTRAVKSTGCSMLKMLLEQDKLIVKDPATINELSTFSAKGLGWEAESGKHDDMVMTLVLFAWLTLDPFFAHMTDENVLMALREKSAEQIESELTPFGIISTFDQEEVDPEFGTPFIDVDISDFRF